MKVLGLMLQKKEEIEFRVTLYDLVIINMCSNQKDEDLIHKD